MDGPLFRRTWHGCEWLGQLAPADLYLTDVELGTGWGLMVVVRQLDRLGRPVEPPMVSPQDLVPALAMVRPTASVQGRPLRGGDGGTIGSLAEGIGLWRFDPRGLPEGPLQLAVELNGTTVTVPVR